MGKEIAPVDLGVSWLLLNHGPVSLITTKNHGQPNVMACAWVMPLDYEPAKIILVLDSASLTCQNIEQTGEFGVQLPLASIADITYTVGNTSGREINKLETFKIKHFDAQKINVPMIENCAAWLECKLLPDEIQKQGIYIAEVVAAYADSELFSGGRWHFNDDLTQRTIHHTAGGNFYISG